MQPVLKWVKANVYTVVFAAVMIAAPVVFWILASGMNAKVRADVAQRADKVNQLNKFEKTSVSFSSPVPGNDSASGSIAVNRRFLDRYEEVVGKLRQDAQQIREEVLNINRKGRVVLNDKLFPSPPAEQREILPKEMYRQLIAAYEQLLKDVHA